jgi:RimJ/RimL family protein N-acetyltransferase
MTQKFILNNGTLALIRPVQPDDLYRIDTMHRRLSATSLYFRYLRPYRPTLADAQRICSSNDHSAGMIATTAVGSDVLGLVHYAVDESLPTGAAELGIVVIDHAQGQGLGRFLLEQISQQALIRGIHEFQMYIHLENEAMIRLLQRIGYPIQERVAYGVREIRMILAPIGQMAIPKVRPEPALALA